jgi:maltose/moltooligosaccharide transporter
MNYKLKQKPDLSRLALFNLSFGFFGVQIAYALQSSNISRIFATMGADPKSLSFFWVLPPLMGMIVQPIVGVLSDRTWCRLGRRIPYLIVGAVIAVIVMTLLPNAGSLSDTFWVAMTLGAIILMFLDTSLNMAMQPFKMMVGDVVNEKQKGTAYAIQSFLCNLGQVVGFSLPFLMSYIGLSTDATHGVPMSLKMAFYVGAVILIVCVIYTCLNVKEMPPKEYAEYHGTTEEKEDHVNLIQLLRDAPANYWRVALVQFFCWFAFLFMWNYTTGAIADTVWGTTDAKSTAFQAAGDWVGIVFAVQSVASVLWAMVLPPLEHRFGLKAAYSVSLLLGALGFALVPFMPDRWTLFIPFALVGCAWAAMLALPFTIVTNALEGRPHMGTYLGLFNCSICLPQIIAGLTGGFFLMMVGEHQYNMMFVAAVLLILGALSVKAIKSLPSAASKEDNK